MHLRNVNNHVAVQVQNNYTAFSCTPEVLQVRICQICQVLILNFASCPRYSSATFSFPSAFCLSLCSRFSLSLFLVNGLTSFNQYFGLSDHVIFLSI